MGKWEIKNWKIKVTGNPERGKMENTDEFTDPVFPIKCSNSKLGTGNPEWGKISLN